METRRPPASGPAAVGADAGPGDPAGGDPPSVAVLYEHALLGEGVARLVRAATGAAVVTACGDDAPVLARVLATAPRVVIIERGPALEVLDLAAAVPGATVIDLGSVGCSRGPVRGRVTDIPEVIDAVRSALITSHPVRDNPR